MAEYRDRAAAFEALGLGIAAISVDEPRRSEAMRRSLGLGFPVLCDVDRNVVTAWGLRNRRERDVAYPATFVIDRDRTVRFAAVEGTYGRVAAEEMVAFARSFLGGEGSHPPRSKLVLPGPRLWLQALLNAVRYGLRSPNPQHGIAQPPDRARRQ